MAHYTAEKSVQYALPGSHVRLLLLGRQGTHVLTADVLAVTKNGLRVSRGDDGKALDVPASAIASVEIGQRGVQAGRWVTAELPPAMRDLAKKIDGLLITGSGANKRTLTAADIRNALEILGSVEHSIGDQESAQLIGELLRACEEFRFLLKAAAYEEAKRSKERLAFALKSLTRQAEGHDAAPTLGRAVGDAARRMARLLDKHWTDYQGQFVPKPRFRSAKEPTPTSVSETGEASFSFRISLDDSYAPARNVSMIIDPCHGMELLTAPETVAVLNPGETKTVSLRATLSADLLQCSEPLRMRAQLKHLTDSQGALFTPKQNLDFALVTAGSYVPIPNPYIAYAGGTKVSDPAMFFGRRTIMEEASFQLASGPLGQCYALYGQKRTGKTSLLEQIRTHLDMPPVIVASLSFGTIDSDNRLSSFVKEVLDQIRIALTGVLSNDDFHKLQVLWPEDERVEKRPLDSLRSALAGARRIASKYPGWAGLRFVLLVDEFTYLFEVLRRPEAPAKELADVREFMRQWKALLESQAFSALVVGQDTMPYFMRRFPNEFSSMSLRRLSYLAASETTDLADTPVRRSDGSSRYSGYASELVHSYTNGHPFFTQILCSRLVEMANERRHADIHEGDVESAVESLVAGPRMLDPIVFDCMLTADNTGLVLSAPVVDEGEGGTDTYDDRGEAAFVLLSELAHASGPTNRYVALSEVENAENKHVLDDLVVREVLEMHENAVRIKVPLFAEYLRRL